MQNPQKEVENYDSRCFKLKYRRQGRSTKRLWKTLREDVARDDILNSMVLAVAARKELQTVPESPAETQPRIYYPTIEQPLW